MRRMRAAVIAILSVALLLTAGLSGVAAADAVSPAATPDGATLIPKSKLTERPFRGVALVSVANSVVCTGWIVGSRKVVTAAHCLTRDATNGKFKFRNGLPGNIRILRAYSKVRGGTPYRICGVSKVWAHPKFIKRNSSDTSFGSRGHDYAVLTTKPGCSFPQNAIMRMWPTEPFDGQLEVGQVSKMSGYPADSRFANTNGLNLWRSQGELRPTGADTRLLNTTGYVAQGMSGGPLWRSFGANSPCGRSQCVIGIITECEINSRGLCKLGNSNRRAVRITRAVKDTIRNH